MWQTPRRTWPPARCAASSPSASSRNSTPYLVAHYAIRCLMHEAAVQAGVDPDRVGFTHALQVLQAAIPEFQMTAPDLLPELYARLLNDLAANLLPGRHLRTNPRVVKRKMSNFRLKRSEHYAWPQPSVYAFRDAVALI